MNHQYEGIKTMIEEENIRQDFAKRLKTASDRLELKGTDIANALKLSTKAVSKWLNAETMPTMANVYALAKLLKVTPEWLIFGDKNSEPITIQDLNQFEYPILSSIQTGMWAEICDYKDSQGYDYLSSEIDTKGEAFFLRITGASMEPKFSKDDLVLIDPSLYPHPGQFVAAVNGSGEAVFKQYKELSDISESSGKPHFELLPLNPMFPTLSSKEQDIRIIGVAVEHRTYL